MTSRLDGEDEVLDVLGIGFGPSNLALAIALEEGAGEPAGSRPVRAAFLERQSQFGWHKGMLIEGATMQVSFLKDLVTMRNPTSDFSFLAYLHQMGRLAAFINTKDVYPSRVEFHDYLSWAAGRLSDRVGYGLDAIGAAPVLCDDDVMYIDVAVRRVADGALASYRTRNIVLATGLEPLLPADALPSPRVWHSSELLDRLADVPADQVQTFVVVGAGQSAAEVVDYLHRRFALAEVHSVFARYGYSPADDTPFVNAIFDPGTVDLYYRSPDDVRNLMLGYHANTNYSVVDRELIADLHRRVYQELVSGEQRLIMRNLSRVVAARDTGTALEVDIKYLPDGCVTPLRADWLVYATGYRPRSPLGLLGDLTSYCKVEPNQSVRLERDHRVVTSERMRCGLYVQGITEASHGLSSTLLSTTAVRAGEIARSIAAGLEA
ncbi:MAG TPA: SidA/IucD/PvdA family monooxygenase [Streptosporangiaceae bacterium]|nr:SidA/IucD/PvdA family monooxygenase [Streptosporangiaceae bacterium]